MIYSHCSLEGRLGIVIRVFYSDRAIDALPILCRKRKGNIRVILISNIHKYETVFFIIDFFLREVERILYVLVFSSVLGFSA